MPIVLGTFQSAQNFGHWKVYHFRSRISTGIYGTLRIFRALLRSFLQQKMKCLFLVWDLQSATKMGYQAKVAWNNRQLRHSRQFNTFAERWQFYDCSIGFCGPSTWLSIHTPSSSFKPEFAFKPHTRLKMLCQKHSSSPLLNMRRSNESSSWQVQRKPLSWRELMKLFGVPWP